MTELEESGLRCKEQLFEALRREIFAAQIKVALDQQLGRGTSAKVKKLTAVKLPPRARSPKRPPEAHEQKRIHLTDKEQLFEALRREIFEAQIKVLLDEQLGRKTAAKVKKLVAVKLPRGVRHRHLDIV